MGGCRLARNREELFELYSYGKNRWPSFFLWYATCVPPPEFIFHMAVTLCLLHFYPKSRVFDMITWWFRNAKLHDHIIILMVPSYQTLWFFYSTVIWLFHLNIDMIIASCPPIELNATPIRICFLRHAWRLPAHVLRVIMHTQKFKCQPWLILTLFHFYWGRISA